MNADHNRGKAAEQDSTAEEFKAMSELKIAIISFAHMHACSYATQFRDLSGATVVAAAEVDPERLEWAKKQFPFISAFHADWRAMLDAANPDAVIITTPNAHHAEIAIECARRGKHILCEKPLATTIADGKAMIAAAKENNVCLMTAFPVRFSPAVGELKRLVKSGALGRIIGASTSNHGSMPGGWFVQKELSGGGAVMDHTVHVADLLRWVLEDEVDEVYAEYARRLHDIPTEDCGQLLLRFRKGTIVSLDTSWSRPKSYSVWGDVKFEVKGEKGNASVNCFPRTMNLYENRTMHHSSAPAVDDMDGLMIREFVSAVKEKREPAVTGTDGLRAFEIALAAYEAGEKGRAVKVAAD
jgi:predicted dehydrogenase